MESQEKILVFCSREICYLSGNFFAHQLAAAFDDLGYETTVCEFTSQGDLDDVLSPFFGKKYRAVCEKISSAGKERTYASAWRNHRFI